MNYLIIRIKNLLPYLILISIYFFFINIEAQNNYQKATHSKQTGKSEETKAHTPDSSIRISIPVIPFSN